MRIIFSHFLILLIFLVMVNPILSQNVYFEFNQKNISVSFNGKFVVDSSGKTDKAQSENGKYRCEYDIGRVGDEVRELVNFKFFEQDQLIYELKQAPGTDLYISNSGVCAFLDMIHHYKGELTIHFYSKLVSIYFLKL